MSQAVSKELTLLVRSGWRLIAFETFEEDRALRLLERSAEACERKLQVWSVASGLDGSGTGAGSLEDGLLAMEEVREPAIFALLDAQSELDSRSLRRLRDWLPVLAKRRQTVVLVGPVIEVPLELVREAGRLSLPLPRVDELEKLFHRV